MSIARPLLVALACVLCAQSFAQPANRRIRGEVTALDGQKLSVTTRGGEKIVIDLEDKYTVTAVVKADIASIRTGAYVGTATIPQPDGTQRVSVGRNGLVPPM